MIVHKSVGLTENYHWQLIRLRFEHLSADYHELSITLNGTVYFSPKYHNSLSEWIDKSVTIYFKPRSQTESGPMKPSLNHSNINLCYQ